MSVSHSTPDLVTGYVLAGGRSSRMGTDKALLETADGPLVKVALRSLRQVCGSVAILSGPPDFERDAILACYARLVPDQGANWDGPLAGVVAALHDCTTPYALLIAVDQPGLPARALHALIQESVTAKAAAACLVNAGRLEPLPMLVSIELGPQLGQVLQAGERRLLPAVQARTSWCGRTVIPVLLSESQEEWFTNLNTPADLHRWRWASEGNDSALDAS